MTQHSSLASVSATRARLDALGLSTKKRLGQHFLIDDGVVGRIVRLASVVPGSSVVEIGPGIGTLTEALLAQEVALSSVELDNSLWQGLAEHCPQLNLIGGDALDSQTIIALQKLAPVALVANLPYAVAATIILEYYQMLPSLEHATVMVQREVAERIAAHPSSKEYGAYTIKLQLLARVVGQFKVSRQSFFPPPRVDSTVIRLERVPFGKNVDDDCSNTSELLAAASMLADAAFFQRRKTIRNSLQAYFAAHKREASSVDSILAAANIDPKARGESLATSDYLALAHAWLGSP